MHLSIGCLSFLFDCFVYWLIYVYIQLHIIYLVTYIFIYTVASSQR